jgi:hypothetical protein
LYIYINSVGAWHRSGNFVTAVNFPDLPWTML